MTPLNEQHYLRVVICTISSKNRGIVLRYQWKLTIIFLFEGIVHKTTLTMVVVWVMDLSPLQNMGHDQLSFTSSSVKDIGQKKRNLSQYWEISSSIINGAGGLKVTISFTRKSYLTNFILSSNKARTYSCEKSCIILNYRRYNNPPLG